MDKAKIRLSPKEAELVINADWILTKNHIIQKAGYLLGQLQSEQQRFLQSGISWLPEEVINNSPKISKGENYKGLPWLVLDYPRYFEKENHFAIRSMFWWGNFFSITLHLSGRYKKMYEPGIVKSFSYLKEEAFSICINDDPWEHHFESGNYSPLAGMTMGKFRENLNAKDFLKLAKTYPLTQWDHAGELLFSSFASMIKWLAG